MPGACSSGRVRLFLAALGLTVWLPPRAADAQPRDAAAPVTLRAGQSQHAHVEPGTELRFEIRPLSLFVEVSVAFDGAEVTASLWQGETMVAAARAPERSRGQVTLSAVAATTEPLRLSLAVVKDYTRAADVTVRWDSRAETVRDRAVAARQADLYESIDDWRSTNVQRLTGAAGRLSGAIEGLRTLDAPDLLYEALALEGQIHGDLNEAEPAIAALTEAADLARARGDGDREGLALLKLAIAQGSIGQPERSRTLLRQALELRRAAGDERGELEALMNVAALQTNTGEQAEGLAALDALAPFAARVGDRRLSAYIDNVRGVALAQTGHPREAIDAYGRALALRREIGDQGGQGQTLSNMGTSWRDVGETRRGIEMMQEALALRRAAGHRQGVANTLYNLGNAYLELGDYQRAIDTMTESLALWRETKGVRGEAFTLQNLGMAARGLGDEVKAGAYFRQTLPLWQQVGDRRGEGIALNYLAGLALSRGAVDEAASFVEGALAANRSAHARREEGDALSTSGEVLRKRGDLQASVVRLGEAIAVQTEIGNRVGAATAHMDLGLTFEAQGRHREALAEYRTALDLREGVGVRRGEASALTAIARLQRKSGALAEAQAAAMRAVDLVEELRLGVAAQRARTMLGVSTQSIYEQARDILIDRHAASPGAGYDRAALAVQERARARSLLEALNEGRPPLPAGDAAVKALADRQVELEADIESKTARLGRLSDASQPADRLAEARAELSALIVELDDVKAEIRRRSPAYAGLTQPKTMSVDDLQHLLDADTVLVEIALGETRSVGWLVSTAGLRTVMLPPRTGIEAAARDVVAAVTARNEFPDGEGAAARRARIARADAHVAAAAAKLDTLVFGPFGTIPARRIAIVADGALSRVPFAVLPTMTSASAAREAVALPSASVLAELRSRGAARPPRTARVAVLADPVFRADDPRVRVGETMEPGRAAAEGDGGEEPAREERRDAVIASLESLPRLPYSREEAKAIESLAGRDGAAVAVDFAASRAALRTPAFAAPGVLHIATHAIVDEAQPDLSGIVLSLVDQHGARVRGFLSLAEVYDLPVAADLVVLSACRTAVGADLPGEGLASLTRGFMYAGTPRVIATLWPVEDRATAAFMRAFYQALLTRGLPPSSALRAAQEELRRSPRWASPYYWAAFTFQGDWQ